MPRSGRSSRPAGNIFPARSNVPLTHISSSAAKEKPLLPVTRGSEIGGATRLSRFAAFASRRIALSWRTRSAAHLDGRARRWPRNHTAHWQAGGNSGALAERARHWREIFHALAIALR